MSAMPRRDTFCGSPDHALDRRAVPRRDGRRRGRVRRRHDRPRTSSQSPALADELKKQQKRVILLWLAGGASQLETWDPKPGAATGGPFRAIQTDVPGVAHLRADAEDGAADEAHRASSAR